MNKKILSIFIFSLFASLAIFAVQNLLAQGSPDAIAIRIMSNPRHMSPIRWYHDQGFTGSPQAISVDGYDAIRDASTVYVNTAHVIDPVAPATQATLYTNIFVLTNSVGSDAQTQEIFNRILTNFKFNTNLVKTTGQEGFCKKTVNDELTATSTKCYNTPECGAGEFCVGIKGKTVRDVRRLEDLEYMNFVLDDYRKTHNNRCPEIESGTYVPNRSVSTWNSWQDELGAVIGAKLPYDPINQLGACLGYDKKTCWDMVNKKFSTVTDKNILNMSLPANSHVYTYGVSEDGLKCGFFAATESGVVCDTLGKCTIDGISSSAGKVVDTSVANIDSPLPEITCGNILGKPGKPLDGADGTSNTFSVKAFNGATLKTKPVVVKLGDSSIWSNWLADFSIINAGGTAQLKSYYLYSSQVGNQYAGSNLIDYTVNISVIDSRGKTNSKNCHIAISAGEEGCIFGDSAFLCKIFF